MGRRWNVSALLCGWLVLALVAGAQQPPDARLPFQDPDLPLDARVRDLIGRLTLEEKASQGVMNCAAIPRLGIPRYHWWSECLHGVARAGKATVFPQAIGLAATWNTNLHFAIASAISDEARAKHQHGKFSDQYGGLTYWSPTINMARDPRWGRTEETYGEDPYLCGKFAAAFVRGLQGDDPRYLKIAATVKHFAANNEEDARYTTRPMISERALREYYLPAFRTAIVEAGCESIMSSYNGINDVPNSMNPWLLTDVLRSEWGFRGTVVTDVSAPERMKDSHGKVDSYPQAAAASFKAGADVMSPWLPDFSKYIVEAVRTGLLDEATLDRALFRSLSTRFRLGMFDPVDRVPWSKIPASVVGCDEHIALALESARQSFVLLKNAPSAKTNAALLPIDASKIRSIAVLGPNAHRILFGGYSGEAAREVLSPVEGVKKAAGPGVEVKTQKWALAEKETWFETIPTAVLRPAADAPPNAHGLRGVYFRNRNLDGEVLTRLDATVDFDWGKKAPDPSMPTESFSVRWSGVLTPPTSGDYDIGAKTDDGARLFLDDKLVIDAWHERGPVHDSITVTLEGGKAYRIVLEYFDKQGDASARLDWVTPEKRQVDRLAPEYELAKSCDVVVAVMGLGPEFEDEDRDRRELGLPKDQESYLQALMAANPNTVLVLMNGGPLSVPWAAEHVPAILEIWYPGEEGGTALGEMLFGATNPSGRLPVTVVASTEQLPRIGDYEISRGRTYQYLPTRPLFAFGHGLSYTTFEYGNATASPEEVPADGTVTCVVRLTNSGSRAGAEVVQAYVHAVQPFAVQPEQRLVAFKRIQLEPKATASVELELRVRDFGSWDPVGQRWVVPAGSYEIRFGASSADIRLRATVKVKA